MPIDPRVTARKAIIMSHVLVQEVEQYRSANRIKTEAAAMRRLIQSGLAEEDRRRLKRQVPSASVTSTPLRQGSPLSALQCRMARAAVRMGISDLATAANVAPKTLVDFEAGKRVPHRRTAAAIRKALEVAGLEFIAERDGAPGVRMLHS